jgi:hypothetical protein
LRHGARSQPLENEGFANAGFLAATPIRCPRLGSEVLVLATAASSIGLSRRSKLSGSPRMIHQTRFLKWQINFFWFLHDYESIICIYMPIKINLW